MPSLDGYSRCEAPIRLPKEWEARSNGGDEGAIVAHESGNVFSSIFHITGPESWRAAAAVLWARIHPKRTPPRYLWSADGVPYGFAGTSVPAARAPLASARRRRAARGVTA